MEKLMEFANKHNLIVIEDCAESHGATVNGRMTGSFGDLACFSFYANKIITTGEGGMVVTDDNALASRLRSFRNLGFGEPRFVHEIAGFNFRMTGYQAALGLSQFSRIEDTVHEKRRIAHTYLKNLEGVPGIQLPTEAEWAKHVYWMFALRITSEGKYTRDGLIEYLLRKGIETRTFFCPMDMQPVLRAKYQMEACPNAAELWETGLYLPSSTKLTQAELNFISSSVTEYLTA